MFQINHQEELHLQYVACAFSIHKVYIISVSEDEQCKREVVHFRVVVSVDADFQQHRMSALIHVREKLMNRKHNVIVFNALQTLFNLTSYLAMSRVFGSSLLADLSPFRHQ